MAGDNTVRFKTQVTGTAQAQFAALDKQLDKVGVKAGTTQKAFGKLNTVFGGMITPTNAILAGTLALGGGLIAVGKAAADEEINVAKLSAALKANIPNWNGNTDAIEKTISAREKLAFSDDELRDSLASLVGATHDVNQAFVLQSTAMDLARFKGISLQEASETLIKIEGGQFRALKALIGSTKDITTTTEALAAVQKVAGGQAEAYAETGVGAYKSLEIAARDLEEEIGKELLPVFKEIATAVRDDVIPAIHDLAPAFDVLGNAISGARSLYDPFGEAQRKAASAFNVTRPLVKGAATDIEDFRGQIQLTTPAVSGLTVKMDRQNAAFQDLRTFADRATDALKDFYGEEQTLAHESVLRDTLKEDEAALRKLEKAHRDGKISTHDYKVELHKLTENILDDKQALLDNLTAQAKMGKSKDLERWIAAQRKNWDRLTAAEKLAVQQAEKYVYYLKLAKDMAAGGFKAGKAAGGPVSAGTAYTVGEKGPETFIPAVNGTIVPNGGGGGSWGGGVNVYISSSLPYSAAQLQDISRILVPELTRVMRQNHVL